MTMGRKFFFTAKLLGIALICAQSAVAATVNLTVTSSVPSTKVLVYLDGTLMSSYNTAVATTTAGSITFPVETGGTYNIVCSSQGYTPTLATQFASPLSEYITAAKTVACPTLTANYSLYPATISFTSSNNFSCYSSGGCLVYSVIYSSSAKSALAFDFNRIQTSDEVRSFTIANVPSASASDTFIQNVVMNDELMKETMLSIALPLSTPYWIDFDSNTFKTPSVSGRVQSYSNAASMFNAEVWALQYDTGLKAASGYLRRTGPDGKYRLLGSSPYYLP
ncbi:MAG TPA: hypothetical protein PLL10_09295, partial [Elusimicrobiales bacterium]|nr:hypothetical protein [Elusimicrobiales bacterium]